MAILLSLSYLVAIYLFELLMLRAKSTRVGLNLVDSSKLGLCFAYFYATTNISLLTVLRIFILREICQNVELPAQCLHKKNYCGGVS